MTNRRDFITLLGGTVATWPMASRAESFDQRQGAAYELADALLSYAKRDYQRALEMLAPLAERGNAVAQLKLGIIFSRGKVSSPDHVAALQWFIKAAEQSQAEAQFELGRIYRDGLGTRVDGKLAVYWLERAAERDTPHAINALGELYLGHQDISKDFAVAIRWFSRGADLGNSASMYNLGVRYALGQGVARDDIEAFKWFELAAHMGIGKERDQALRACAALAERLTPVEVSWGEGRVADWFRAHQTISASQ